MNKQVQVFFRMLFIGILVLGAHAQFAVTAQTQTITMTTAKAVGDKITLNIRAEGDVSIDGATGTFVNGKNVEYTLAKQTVTITGKVVTLNCHSNQLTSLDVSKNAALTYLTCTSNQLTNLDISKNTALIRLTCSFNQLTDIDASKNTVLTGLFCDSNRFTRLDVSKNAALIWLYCSKNQLTSLDLSKNTALKKLYCHTNRLESLDVSTNAALTELYCHTNRLENLDVSTNAALTDLSCAGNQLTSLDVSKNPALLRFDCVSNQLTKLDVSKNADLIYLGCFSNQIKGEAMTSLVNSLPTSREGEVYVINTKDTKEQNACTKADVTIAKGKGWKVYDFNGNWNDRKEYAGSDGNSVAAINSGSVQIYPNPAMDFVQITGAKAIAIIRLHSLDGRLVLTAKADADGAVRLDVSTLATGEYLLVVGDECSKLFIE